MRAPLTLLLALPLALLATRADDGGAEATRDLATARFEERELEGFRVRVQRELLEPEHAGGAAALRLLATQLHLAARALPAAALERLREVPIWVEEENADVACACYHPSARWLSDNGFNADKARAVEIGNVAHFLAWSREQPWMVVHELAHAYHHQVLGHDHAGIRAAFAAAVDSGAYEEVLHANGSEVRHYALSNEQEYFAELSESWFGTNDFYPFVRAELARHDPAGYALMAEVWSE